MAKKPATVKARKVYRTSIGFHDAYVAAPSKKAALEAWGSTKDLFARGAAELVTDPAAGKEALASPGIVIKRSRGTVEEQLAALPVDPAPKASRSNASTKPAKTVKKAAPKPSRRALDDADAKLEVTVEQHKRALEKIADQQAALDAQKRRLLDEQDAELTKLSHVRDEASQAYEASMDAWRR